MRLSLRDVDGLSKSISGDMFLKGGGVMADSSRLLKSGASSFSFSVIGGGDLDGAVGAGGSSLLSLRSFRRVNLSMGRIMNLSAICIFCHRFQNWSNSF